MSAVAAPNNLPFHLTTFVNREADLRSLKTLLRTTRMVTLTGTGGAGKSRLAAEVAKANRDEWPDGICWVELAAESDVGGAVVGTLELPGRGTPQQVVSSWLAPRHALLILDNCEHLVADCAAFSRALLERCAQLTVLATSREPLGVPGEVRWAVSSLGEPEALSLFEARARLVSPDFKVAPPNREPVSAICDRLDRLPLAIEMAAARLDLMSERELLANLNDRFRLLASGTRSVPERQQRMAAAIDWSHRLLSTNEARLFQRLAVFQGGFTLQAAQAVCSESDIGSVLGPLGALVQKSMVVADRLDDGSTRYRLLESHHDFALEKLRAAGEQAALERRHYEYFKTLPWKSRESANFWSALAWARENAEDGGLGLLLEVADAGYSDQARALKLLLEQLDRPGAEPLARARALNLAARLTSRQGDYAAAHALADQSVDAARELRDGRLLAHMLAGAGVVYQAGRDLEAAHRMYDEALALLKGSGNQRLAIEVQNQMSVLVTEQGRYQEAIDMLAECIAFSRSQNEDALTARYLESVANAELQLQRVADAADHWRKALLIFRDVNDPFGSIWCVGGLALAAAAQGDHERALRLAAVAGRMSREWSLSAWPGRINELEQATKQARARLGPRKADGAWDDGLSMNDARAFDYALSEGLGYEPAVSAGPLSRREREVAAMVAAGMTNKQIAEKLFIAERTAEGHVERIRNKLGVRSRTEVATWAVAHRLGPTRS